MSYTAYIYKSTNTKNCYLYIGMTRATVEERWMQHLKNAKKSDRPLYVAMRADGIEHFTVESIESIEYKYWYSHKLWNQEQYWMKHYQSFGPNGYNMIDANGIGR